jgi:hypothetical protein
MISYTILLRNHKLISSAFQEFLRCANLSPQIDCIQPFRSYAVPQLILAADFVWQAEAATTPTIFLFAYKEVRALWFSIVTCDFCSRRSTVSQEENHKSGKNVLPTAGVPKIVGTEV